MNKRTTLSIITLFSVVFATFSFIWILSEISMIFIANEKFNWWSVWIFLGLIILIIVSSTFFSKLPPPEVDKQTVYTSKQQKIQFPE